MSQSPLALVLRAECQSWLDKKMERLRHCINQLDDHQIWWRPRESMNSIGNILLHLCGNVTQWVINGVQQTPDTRNRPQEFAERSLIPKVTLMDRLESVITEAKRVIAGVNDEQWLAPRRIQGFDETVLSAVLHSLEHFSGHVQEIIYITRLQLGDKYQFAWTPSTPEEGATTTA